MDIFLCLFTCVEAWLLLFIYPMIHSFQNKCKCQMQNHTEENGPDTDSFYNSLQKFNDLDVDYIIIFYQKVQKGRECQIKNVFL